MTLFKLLKNKLFKGVTHFFLSLLWSYSAGQPMKRNNTTCAQLMPPRNHPYPHMPACLTLEPTLLPDSDRRPTEEASSMENHAGLWTHGDMAHRFLSSANRFSARFAFIITVSLSCTYLCYNIIFCRGTIMTNQGYEGKRCPPGKNAGGKKLLGKLDHCALLKARSTLDESAAQRGASDLREQSKAPSSDSHWTDAKLKNISVAQKYGNKKLPNALIVGVKKGGTRAVLEFIRIHPDVRALGTEPHFFDRNYDRGLDWYRWEKRSKHWKLIVLSLR